MNAVSIEHKMTAPSTAYAFLDAPELSARVGKIEIFCCSVNKARHFSWGSWTNRHHAAIAFHSENNIGWGELLAGSNGPVPDLTTWMQQLAPLQGMSVAEALQSLEEQREQWNHRAMEAAQFALLDIAGRLLAQPSIHLFGLTGTRDVPGLACVLQPTPELAAEESLVAIQSGLRSHLKIKIFGDAELDLAMVKAVREVIPRETYLIADANLGYPFSSGDDLQPLADQLIRLHAAGLSASEDPAQLTSDEWVELQSRVGDLALIPDVPTRPSWHALESLPAGMGKIYNLHPGCLGSVMCVPPLARRIQESGSRVMIGDNSLIGPACTAWQQVAIGLGAAWVEALEKLEESDAFTSAIRSQATRRTSDGQFGFSEAGPLPGFGLEVDFDLLRKNADAVESLDLPV